MFYAQVVRQLLFQLLVKSATVSQDAILPNLLHVRHELLKRRQKRTRDKDVIAHMQTCTLINESLHDSEGTDSLIGKTDGISGANCAHDGAIP